MHDVAGFRGVAAEKSQGYLESGIERGQEPRIAVRGLPDRVGEADQDDIVRAQFVEAEGDRPGNVVGIALDDCRTESLRVLYYVGLCRPSNHPNLVGRSRAHALDHVVHDRPAVNRVDLLRARERLHPRGEASRRNDAYDPQAARS